MIPISDDNPRRRIPVVTWLIILINVLVWLYEVLLPAPALNQLFASVALIPLRITKYPDAGAIFSLFSSMFMHAGWLHIIGNMLYLWIFGDNVEDRLGHILFLLFYLAGGLLAALAQVAFAPSSDVPILGASGAIAAVLGTYLVLFPHQRVRNLIIFFPFIRTIDLPAIWVLGFWFILQILSGITAIATTATGGTASFAHIGGFIFGLLVGVLALQFDRAKSSPYFIPR
jgi:membrane associated rhomboid family serine protease